MRLRLRIGRLLGGAAKRFLVVAVAVMVVLALAPQAHAATKKRKISMTVSATTITAGSQLTISGKVKPKSKKTKVWVQRQTSTGWVTLKKVKPSKRGAYKYRVTPGTRGDLRLRAYVPKSGKYRGSYSPTRTVRVNPARTSVRITATGPTGIDVGQTMAIRGTTSANLIGKTVRLQARRGTAWSAIATTTVTKSATYAFAVKATSAGRRQVVRINAAPTAGTIEASSAAVIFSVYPAPANRSYLFQDDFSGSKLDPAKWGTRHQEMTGRRMCSQPSEDMVSVSGGTAQLKVRMRPGSKSVTCPHGVWDNAMIGTGEGADKASFTHGTFIARVRFQPGAGMHGAFWLQGRPVTGAEIDVAEYFGDGRSDGGLSSYVHYVDAQQKEHTTGGIQNSRKILPAGQTPSNGWHTYSVDWDASGYIFRIDGYPTLITSKPHVATSPETVILSLLTSDWELPRLTNPTSTMYVDWVRAWN